MEKEKRSKKLAALGEMAARVAHELNPISVLGGFTKRLEKNIDVPEAELGT